MAFVQVIRLEALPFYIYDFYLEEMSVEAEALDSTFYFILFVLSLTAAVAGQLIINHRQGIHLDNLS